MNRTRERKAGEDVTQAQLAIAHHELLFEAAHRGAVSNGHDAPSPGAAVSAAELATARAGGPRWFEERHEALALRLAAACEQVGPAVRHQPRERAPVARVCAPAPGCCYRRQSRSLRSFHGMRARVGERV